MAEWPEGLSEHPKKALELPDGTRALSCPICDHTEVTKPRPTEDPSGIDMALGLAPGTMKLRMQHEWLQAIEDALQVHLCTHTPLEWVTAVVALQKKLEQAHAHV